MVYTSYVVYLLPFVEEVELRKCAKRCFLQTPLCDTGITQIPFLSPLPVKLKIPLSSPSFSEALGAPWNLEGASLPSEPMSENKKPRTNVTSLSSTYCSLSRAPNATCYVVVLVNIGVSKLHLKTTPIQRDLFVDIY